MTLKGKRTLLWQAINAIVYVVGMIPQAPYPMPESWIPIWFAVYVAGNVVLRFATTTGVFKSE